MTMTQPEWGPIQTQEPIKFQFYVQQVDGGFAIFQSSWRGDTFLRKRQHSMIYNTAKAADRRCASLIGQAADNKELRHG